MLVKFSLKQKLLSVFILLLSSAYLHVSFFSWKSVLDNSLNPKYLIKCRRPYINKDDAETAFEKVAVYYFQC